MSLCPLNDGEEVKAPCGHAAKHLKYDKATRTIQCELCVNPPLFIITEAEAQMDEGGEEKV